MSKESILNVVRVREGDIVIYEDLSEDKRLLMSFGGARSDRGKLEPLKAAIYCNTDTIKSLPTRACRPSTVIEFEPEQEGVRVTVTNPKKGFQALRSIKGIIQKVTKGVDVMEGLINLPHQDWAEGRPTVFDFTKFAYLLRNPKRKIIIIK